MKANNLFLKRTKELEGINQHMQQVDRLLRKMTCVNRS